jgi:hypothetical protein
VLAQTNQTGQILGYIADGGNPAAIMAQMMAKAGGEPSATVTVEDTADPVGTLYPVYVWDYTPSFGIPHTFIQTPIRTSGFYPKSAWHYAALFVTCPGEVRDDSNHPRNASPTQTFWVDGATLLQIDQGMSWSPTCYELNNGFWSNSFNCTGWANRVLSNVGLNSGWSGVGANPWTN